jgi:hypothetical protein
MGMDSHGIETITTNEGNGEAFIVKSPLGVQATTWTINLPWGSWEFCGSYNLMLRHVAKRIAQRDKEEDE